MDPEVVRIEKELWAIINRQNPERCNGDVAGACVLLSFAIAGMQAKEAMTLTVDWVQPFLKMGQEAAGFEELRRMIEAHHQARTFRNN